MTIKVYSAGAEQNVIEYRYGGLHGWASLIIPDTSESGGDRAVYKDLDEDTAQKLIEEHGLVEMG